MVKVSDLKMEHVILFVIVAFLLYHLIGGCGCSSDGFSVGGQLKCNNISSCNYLLENYCDKNESRTECLKCINDHSSTFELNNCNTANFNNFCIKEDYTNKYTDNNFSDVDFNKCIDNNNNDDLANIFNTDIKSRQNFENASFVNSYIMFVDFSDLNLENSNFTNADISYSNFKNTNLKNSNLKDAKHIDSFSNLCNDSTILDGTGYHCTEGLIQKNK